jgi:hypothetical protein
MVISSPFGARTDGEGEEKDVRCGFCFKAACSGAEEEGGVIKVMSEIPDLRRKSMA